MYATKRWCRRSKFPGWCRPRRRRRPESRWRSCRDGRERVEVTMGLDQWRVRPKCVRAPVVVGHGGERTIVESDNDSSSAV
jgi:hypothetical protein